MFILRKLREPRCPEGILNKREWIKVKKKREPLPVNDSRKEELK